MSSSPYRIEYPANASLAKDIARNFNNVERCKKYNFGGVNNLLTGKYFPVFEIPHNYFVAVASFARACNEEMLNFFLDNANKFLPAGHWWLDVEQLFLQLIEYRWDINPALFHSRINVTNDMINTIKSYDSFGCSNMIVLWIAVLEHCQFNSDKSENVLSIPAPPSANINVSIKVATKIIKDKDSKISMIQKTETEEKNDVVRNSLLDEIKNNKCVLKRNIPKVQIKSSSGDILQQIRDGFKLNSVSERVLSSGPLKVDRDMTIGDMLRTAFMKKFTNSALDNNDDSSSNEEEW